MRKVKPNSNEVLDSASTLADRAGEPEQSFCMDMKLKINFLSSRLKILTPKRGKSYEKPPSFSGAARPDHTADHPAPRE